MALLLRCVTLAQITLKSLHKMQIVRELFRLAVFQALFLDFQIQQLAILKPVEA